MKLQFSWDGEQVTAVLRDHVRDAGIEQMLARGCSKAQLLKNLQLNARLDSLDDIEAAWLAVQEAYQQTPTPELLAKRTALEADNPWLASYRGEAAGSRPDVSADVLARCKDFARRWMFNHADDRHSNEITVSGKVIKLDAHSRTVLMSSALEMALNGTAYGTPAVRIPAADGSTMHTLSETQFRAAVTAMMTETRNADVWAGGQIVAIDGAADLDALWTALS